MIKNLIQKMREKRREKDGVKYYQSPYDEESTVNHYQKRPSYKIKTPWKMKSNWKYDSWKN